MLAYHPRLGIGLIADKHPFLLTSPILLDDADFFGFAPLQIHVDLKSIGISVHGATKTHSTIGHSVDTRDEIQEPPCNPISLGDRGV
ncbi:hypothetical protein D3C84_939080 [compost metagenome]